MTHLFLFTLTPVQSFISQARKTQDLWAGSRMLSDLVKEAIETIQHYSHLKAKVIFPYVEGKKIDELESLPNRILAEFTFPDDVSDNKIKEIGKNITNAISKKLGFDENNNYNNLGFIKDAKNKIGEPEYNKIKVAFETQLKDYFSTFWVFVEVKDGNYVAAYEKADRLLGAVKNSRTFTQNPEQGRKCSLSGEQNALVFQYIEPTKDNGESEDDFQKRKDENLQKRLNDLQRKFVNSCALVADDSFGEGEGLSAISYLKRIYKNEEGAFPSTAKVALMKDLEFFGEKVTADYKNLFKGYFDEQLYFEENLTKDYFKKHGLKKTLRNGEVPSNIKDMQRLLGSKLKTKYYAILLFDADSMGAWLSGDFIEESKKSEQLYDFHKHISSLLSGFADYAKNYVDGLGSDKIKKGRTVYAGGDDYLGFINLHYLFEVMKHLREQFKAQVSDRISNNNQFQILPNPKTNSDEMTFSAGISIAHYKTPLSEVLNWARKMEKEAKNLETDKKDKFGIAVLKKSGEIHKAVLPFKETQTSYFSDKMQIIVSSLDKKFSNKFITSFEQETYLIADSGSGKLNDDILDILEFEVLRLTKRAKIEATDAELSNLQNSVNSILKTSNKAKKALSFDSPIQNFTASLNVCDFINRKLQGND